jgi:hypothetical protein
MLFILPFFYFKLQPSKNFLLYTYKATGNSREKAKKKSLKTEKSLNFQRAKEKKGSRKSKGKAFFSLNST